MYENNGSRALLLGQGDYLEWIVRSQETSAEITKRDLKETISNVTRIRPFRFPIPDSWQGRAATAKPIRTGRLRRA